MTQCSLQSLLGARQQQAGFWWLWTGLCGQAPANQGCLCTSKPASRIACSCHRLGKQAAGFPAVMRLTCGWTSWLDGTPCKAFVLWPAAQHALLAFNCYGRYSTLSRQPWGSQLIRSTAWAAVALI